MAYRHDTDLTKEICTLIGWNFECQPIKTLARKGTVYVTGTLLKPNEWRALRSWDGSKLADGRTIKITYVPSRICW